MTKAIDLISGKFDDYGRERREKDKIIKELKSEVSDLNISVKNLENELDRQEQYSPRNCILIHAIVKFAHYNTRRNVFVNKKRLKNTGTSIDESLTKHRMELLKQKTNLDLIMFGR